MENDANLFDGQLHVRGDLCIGKTLEVPKGHNLGIALRQCAERLPHNVRRMVLTGEMWGILAARVAVFTKLFVPLLACQFPAQEIYRTSRRCHSQIGSPISNAIRLKTAGRGVQQFQKHLLECVIGVVRIAEDAVNGGENHFAMPVGQFRHELGVITLHAASILRCPDYSFASDVACGHYHCPQRLTKTNAQFLTEKSEFCRQTDSIATIGIRSYGAIALGN